MKKSHEDEKCEMSLLQKAMLPYIHTYLLDLTAFFALTGLDQTPKTPLMHFVPPMQKTQGLFWIP